MIELADKPATAQATADRFTLEMVEPAPAALPALQQQAPPARQLSVVEYAVQNGAPVSEVRALVELQIQMDNHKLEMRKRDDERERELRAEAARNAYAEAMAAFKAEGVKVVRSKLITDGPLKGKKHADVFSVVDAATEAMSKHGLSATWETLQDDKDWIKIACRIKHVAGHSEAVAFGGPVDTGPGRNAIQARKSTVSYLNRITMELALGLAESDEDDDGAGGRSGSEAATDKDAEEIKVGEAAAQRGMKPLNAWWAALNGKQRNQFEKAFGAMRRTAQQVDKAAGRE